MSLFLSAGDGQGGMFYESFDSEFRNGQQDGGNVS